MKRLQAAGGMALLVGLSSISCAHGGGPAPQAAPTPPAARASDDAVPRLIADADGRLAEGRAELQQGHLDKARDCFDRAVDAYLTAPGGAYSDPRLAEAYRRTLEAVHVAELEALAAGDGFTEKPAEPASIDQVAELPVPEGETSDESRRAAQQAVQTETNDFPVVLNDAVLACIDLYQGRLRDWFAAALARGGRYLPRIRQIFAEEGVPQDLAYTAMVESAFHTQALSRARAKGVWQFVAETGRRYGLEQDWWVDERSDPEKATRAAARYLKELYQMFGDWNLALAGYNAGEAVVARATARYHTSDFWELRKTRGLRRETKNYVPLIHAAIVVAKAPATYGFEITPEPALDFESVPVEGPVDLRVIAECLSLGVGDIQSLNPELRRLATPANRTFALKVPTGTGGNLESCLSSLPADKRVHFRTHVVARGQTLASIAAQYGARTRDIADANGLALTSRLAIGQELIIPIDPRPAAPAVRRASQTPAAAAEPGPPTRVSYRIKPGDTLAGIASQYGTTVENLQSWNGLRGTRIAAGSLLTIYTNKKF